MPYLLVSLTVKQLLFTTSLELLCEKQMRNTGKCGHSPAQDADKSSSGEILKFRFSMFKI